MRYLIFILISCLFINCNDGDIVFEDFELSDATVEVCLPSGSTGSLPYVFYKVNSSTAESLSLAFTSSDPLLIEPGEYTISLSQTNLIEYRTYSSAPGSNYFCNAVPPATPRVTDSYTGSTGTFTLTTMIEEEDDNDGIPAAIELLNGDTDGDGIPDYLDVDDDGDNVLTINEGVVVINGMIDLTRSLDTDGDGILNYMDQNDDGDRVDTIQEDLNGDLDPTNDFTGASPNYLDANATNERMPAINEYRVHTQQRATRISIRSEDLTLTNGSNEVRNTPFNFGEYLSPVFTVTTTPNF